MRFDLGGGLDFGPCIAEPAANRVSVGLSVVERIDERLAAAQRLGSRKRERHSLGFDVGSVLAIAIRIAVGQRLVAPVAVWRRDRLGISDAAAVALELGERFTISVGNCNNLGIGDATAIALGHGERLRICDALADALALRNSEHVAVCARDANTSPNVLSDKQRICHEQRLGFSLKHRLSVGLPNVPFRKRLWKPLVKRVDLGDSNDERNLHRDADGLHAERHGDGLGHADGASHHVRYALARHEHFQRGRCAAVARIRHLRDGRQPRVRDAPGGPLCDR